MVLGQVYEVGVDEDMMSVFLANGNYRIVEAMNYWSQVVCFNFN